MIELVLAINLITFSLCTGVLSESRDVELCVDGRMVFATEYALTNNRANDAYTWIIMEPQDIVSPVSKSIHNYLWRPCGDFSLGGLLTEEIVVKEFTPEVGRTFIKKLVPGETFKYYVVQGQKPIQGIIVCLSNDELRRYVGSPVNTVFLYNKSFVIVE